jgi:hypothetical protein
MSGKELRINDRKFQIYDWMETFGAYATSPSTGEPVVSSFRFTLPKQVPLGSTVLIEGREGIVESIEPADARNLSLGAFQVRGSLFTR